MDPSAASQDVAVALARRSAASIAPLQLPQLTEGGYRLARALRNRPLAARDFASADALQRSGHRRGDVALLVEQTARSEIAVEVQPLTPLGIARGLLAPPILRLTGLPLRQPAPVLALIALSTAAQLLSMIAEPGEPAPALDEIERHLARLEAAHMTSDATLRAAAFDLKTWVLAWRGLADGDVVRLEDARTRLVTMQARACDTWSGCNRSGMLALVSLALGGEVGGAERLAEAELAASEALSLAIELSEPAIIATCCALAGRTSLALGRARTDVRLLESARVRFDEAQRLSAGAWSDGACGLGDIAAEIGDVEAAIQELDAPLKRTAAPLTRDPPTLSLVRLTSRS